MANALAEGIRWTNSQPAIYLSFYYDYQRSGANMQYRFYMNISPVYGASSFGYPIYTRIYLDGAQVVYWLNKGASESQWTSTKSYDSGWLTVANKTSGSVTVAFNVYSGSGSIRNETYSYSLYVSPASSSIGTLPAIIAELPFSVPVTKYSYSFTDNLTLSVGGETILTVNGYNSGSSIQLTPSQILSVYDQLSAGSFGKISATISLTTYNGSTAVGSTSSATTIQAQGTARVRVNGAYTLAIPWVNINGVWKKTIGFVNANNVWRLGK